MVGGTIRKYEPKNARGAHVRMADNYHVNRLSGGVFRMIDSFLSDFGYDEWQTDVGGTLICPHGNRCEDDQRAGLGECGCVSPLVQEGMI